MKEYGIRDLPIYRGFRTFLRRSKPPDLLPQGHDGCDVHLPSRQPKENEDGKRRDDKLCLGERKSGS